MVSEIQQKQLSDSAKRSNSKLSDRTIDYLSVARQLILESATVNKVSLAINNEKVFAASILR